MIIATYNRAEIGRKLAIVAGLSPEGLPEIGTGGFIVRKAAIEKPVKVKAHVAHVIRSNNDKDNNEDEKTIIGRKLALVAGIL